MRYELKMTFDVSKLNSILQILFSSPLVFKEIYNERQVNNIYFDTLDFQDLKANVDGLYHRSKFRIRWYGKDEHFYPILEEKIKKGDLGDKKSIDINEILSKQDIIKHYKSIQLKDLNQSHRLAQRHPTLINSYTRRYYQSANKKIRVTLDKNLSFSHPIHHNKVINLHNTAILELKFEQEDYPMVQNLIQNLDLRFDKNSKYVEGISQLNR